MFGATLRCIACNQYAPDRCTCATPAPVQQAAPSDRAAFEAWHNQKFRWMSARCLILDCNYADQRTQERWETWQAASAAPAQPVTQVQQAAQSAKKGRRHSKMPFRAAKAKVGSTWVVYDADDFPIATTLSNASLEGMKRARAGQFQADAEFVATACNAYAAAPAQPVGLSEQDKLNATNARLIAAAPTLLAALESMLADAECFAKHLQNSRCVDDARAAILAAKEAP